MANARHHKSSDDWGTPEYIYNPLDKEFDFNFDPCPLGHAERISSGLWNGLDIEWKERNFINPPYNAIDKPKFILKSIEESKKGKLCVVLVPVATSTRLFHDTILPNISEPIRFFRGRIKFVGKNSRGEQCTWGAMHDSMLLIFDGREKYEI